MIFLTGDLHGDFSRLYEFAEEKYLTKSDYVIVLGDFGIWKMTVNEILKLDESLPFTLMFLDGNHEDFDLLQSFPVSEKWGGKVRNINGVYHLCRGQVFEIPKDDGIKTVAVMGGGDSRDISRRIEGETWFDSEQITDYDMEELEKNLELYHNRVDVFLSHSPSAKFEEYIKDNIKSLRYPPTMSNLMIAEIHKRIDTQKSYCGHNHLNVEKVELDGIEYNMIFKDFLEIT
ncbi:MAG: metallophosphoesterase [Clostridia bacterium]|nr:metallophosphoesterase [Clostridia bacterium]